jgi:hypothetical protein
MRVSHHARPDGPTARHGRRAFRMILHAPLPDDDTPAELAQLLGK